MNTLCASDVSELLDRAGPGRLVFLAGVGGCGVSGLAHLLLDLGFAVAGSDLVENDEIRRLWQRGAEIQIGHDAGLIRARQPILVGYSPAVPPDNPELATARELGIPTVRRAVLLAALFSRQRGIAVTGMHGKTTTSALLAFALDRLGAAPGFAIGARVPQLERHARLTPGAGTNSYFVIEADESDGLLREFTATHAIVLNIDAEHLDHYAGLEAIRREFAAFVEKVREKLIYCADEADLATLAARHSGAVSWGFAAGADYRCEGGPDRFEVWHDGRALGPFALQIPGRHNVSNATAVIALLDQLGWDGPAVSRTISEFTGASRRQEEIPAGGGCRLFDDYGHHPREIAATIAALREHCSGRLLVAFQPHRYTRTRDLLGDFAVCFRGADRLWLTEIYAASEPPIDGVNGAALSRAVGESGQPAEFVASIEHLAEAVRAEVRSGDTILFLGAGDITQAAHRLGERLRGGVKAAGPADSWADALKALLSTKTVVRRDEPMARRTTLRVGGRADVYVEPASEAELSAILEFCASRQLPFFLLGRGSNLLVRDGGLRGVVIGLAHSSFSRVEVGGEVIRCGAGAKLKTLAVEARRHGLSGLEFLEGIPGSVGGSLRMNAGAMGGAIFDVVESVRIMDAAGRVSERAARELDVHYRECPMLKNHIALGAMLHGSPRAAAGISDRMNAYNKKRWESQPAQPSAGCIFKNPESIPAGRLIDELGLKGKRLGGAMVSDVHGNFIVNLGGATARDVLGLIELVRSRAREERGFELRTEVEIVGSDDPS